MDLGIEVMLAVFSREGLEKTFAAVNLENGLSENGERIYSLRSHYIDTIDEVILFLQGKNSSLARKICSENLLPQAARFQQVEDLEWAFGSMGIQDKAKYLATLFLEDLSDFIKECIDHNFGFSRYAERLGMSANSFDELYTELNQLNTFIDGFTLNILEERIIEHQPKLVCLSVPFPGNLYSAFKCAQHIKQNHPKIKVAMGGGFPNTELRSLSDKRVFEYFDFISLDDGELPVELIFSNVENPDSSNPNFNFLKRTFVLDNDEVVYNDFSLRKDYEQKDLGTPDYRDLKLDEYISVIEVANPMHSLWSDGRWLKLTMAHGCYWGKCTFCDISLSYIKDYEPLTAKLLVDRMEEMIEQTGERGFHFVDEAAPPALMKELAIEIIRRKLKVSWWTNIRFEKSFTWDLCQLLQASGCIAVSGGLEVASNRLLELIQKGVTVEQVASVSRNFTGNGIMVHAYLMYAYPSQTAQETVDSLEMVRQMFEQEILQSGFWHQFAMTAHSPVGMEPESYGVKPINNPVSFAHNDVEFEDSTGIDHNLFSYGLKKSLYNYMHGICFDYDLQEWFDIEIPSTSVEPDFIEKALEQQEVIKLKSSTKIYWLGTTPSSQDIGEFKRIIFHNQTESAELLLEKELAEWLLTTIDLAKVGNKEALSYQSLRESFELKFSDFDAFWASEEMDLVRELGMVVI